MFISPDISRRYDIRHAPYLTRKPTKAPHFQWRDDRRGERAAVEVLRELMAANDLKQADLFPIFGSKGIVSEVVNGKRGISKANAKALGEFFNISPAAFI